jgi:hypothetical protein
VKGSGGMFGGIFLLVRVIYYKVEDGIVGQCTYRSFAASFFLRRIYKIVRVY